MSNNLHIGDKVICINKEHYFLKYNQIYKIVSIREDAVKVEGSIYYNSSNYFQSLKQIRKEKLKQLW